MEIVCKNRKIISIKLGHLRIALQAAYNIQKKQKKVWPEFKPNLNSSSMMLKIIDMVILV